MADYADRLMHMGATAFCREYRRAVLVGYGMLYGVTDRPARWSRRTLPIDEHERLTAVRSITDRVWSVKKDPGSPRGPYILLGAAQGVDVVINDYSVSTQHCGFSFEPGRLVITDLDSLNGTYVNGQRLTPQTSQPIQDRDAICIGRIKMQLLTRESFFELVQRHLEGLR